MRAHQIEQFAFTVAEIAGGSIQDETHQQAAINHERHGDGMIDADTRVVVGVQAAVAEGAHRHAVRNALHDQPLPGAMKAHQRMFVEMPVESLDFRARKCRARRRHHRAVAGAQVAGAQGGDFRSHQAVQRAHPGVRVGRSVLARCVEAMEHVQRG